MILDQQVHHMNASSPLREVKAAKAAQVQVNLTPPVAATSVLVRVCLREMSSLTLLEEHGHELPRMSYSACRLRQPAPSSSLARHLQA